MVFLYVVCLNKYRHTFISENIALLLIEIISYPFQRLQFLDMARILNYQHFFYFEISTPILKYEKIKKLCICHHTNQIFYRSVYFFIMPVQVDTHIISYVISHYFYKRILCNIIKTSLWVCDE